MTREIKDRYTHYDTNISSHLEIEEFTPNQFNLILAKQDGDGDDCGSWDRNLIMITNDKDEILYNDDWFAFNTSSKLEIKEQCKNIRADRERKVNELKEMFGTQHAEEIIDNYI
jgi:hypothetical protein